MKNIYTFILSFALVALLPACDDGFEEMNQDPNNPTSVPTSYMLAGAQTNLMEELFGLYNESAKWNLTGMRYMQYWTSTLYTDVDRYVTIEGDFTPVYYKGLRDLQQVINLNTDPETAAQAAFSGPNQNQIAVSRILKAYAFHNLTDIWGDIPYSQTLLGSENVTPLYDSQEQIYEELLQELDEAHAQIEEGAGDIEGDLIYGGDMTQWKLFAQSLRLRLGMRLTEVKPELGQAVVTDALQKGVFTSNEQNATFTYNEQVPFVNPWYAEFHLETITLAVSNTMIDKLIELEDPRLPYFANEAEDLGEYIGMPYGVNAATAGSIKNEEVSLPADAITTPTYPAMLQTYSEVLFLRAEAAARAWTGEDAEQLYEQAIAASFEQWGVNDADLAAYLAQEDVAFDASNYKASIGNQKWLALYMQGMEAWSEWRRLDYPALLPAPDAAAGRDIPRRRGYPLTEISLNKKNYDEAIARQGPDLMSTRVWWDK
ncbi:SusD/RagB family nutrient-binding outer membrane lipoprotein [Catalinimonas niigatensis]|uniref:SusD/RagB family nutrient-binding outer membrane lipoprotein n=1 Tax=Catalinimonas niigatensis TaxID=1397264 RepID=UPI0026657C83|nr:SusD/RagB family nutrient-binding outer membrane lipoprotein [Catalinimonas niigatensis]WPP53252.1 SusD/RagB family nutrient-binding outer membrane lipoprotein [Catalinimonas niigatensis]